MTIRGPIRIERIIALGLIICFVAYGLFEGYKLISGPKIEITSPLDGATVEGEVLIIEGKARNVSFIALNDRQIYVDENNIFRQKLLLPEGYTIIKVTAEDRFQSRVEEKIAVWRSHTEAGKNVIEELTNASTTIDIATSTATSTEESE